ncbi:hypothetical protein MMC22_008270 [Lobaria immixta]|nr:hypothetical protein [Lobaria immixta]
MARQSLGDIYSKVIVVIVLDSAVNLVDFSGPVGEKPRYMRPELHSRNGRAVDGHFKKLDRLNSFFLDFETFSPTGLSPGQIAPEQRMFELHTHPYGTSHR